jgi:hypothetical protein
MQTVFNSSGDPSARAKEYTFKGAMLGPYIIKTIHNIVSKYSSNFKANFKSDVIRIQQKLMEYEKESKRQDPFEIKIEADMNLMDTVRCAAEVDTIK